MPRKSRNRKELALVRELSTDDALGPDRATVRRLTGDLHQTLETLVTGCVLLAQADDPLALLDVAAGSLAGDLGDIIGDDTDAPDDPLDDQVVDALEAELSSLGDALEDVATTTRALARALIARVLGHEPPHIGPHTIPSEVRLSRADRNAALDEAAVLLREVGLEEFDVWCELALGPDGTPELFIDHVSPERAHVSLLEFLFDRAEAVVPTIHPLIVAERDASAWEFSCWSVSPPPGARSPEATDFSRRVREQEYSLVDHRTITLGDSVIGQIATDDGFAEIFPRQHRLAGALVASVVDVFECVALDGNRATLRSVRDGRTYHVYEHMESIEYSTGWICAGRLLPFADALHLRSPGMIFVRPDRPDLVRDAAASLAMLGQMLQPALALEGTISSVVFGLNVPRDKKPMPSKARAREALDALLSILSDPDLASEIGPDEDALRGDSERLTEPAVEGQVDATLDAFMAALSAQAEAGGARQEPQRARRRKKAKRRR